MSIFDKPEFGIRLFVNPIRADGKHAVTFVYKSTGKNINKIYSPAQIEEAKKSGQIEVVYK